MVEKYTNFLRVILFFVFLSFFPSETFAQCAGDDGEVPPICNVADVSNQTIDLFAFLNGLPLTGGEWTDDNGSGGLNATTGILNAHLIRRSGTFNYTYTVEGFGLCPDNSATVKVTIGGYSGVSSPNVSVCSAVETFNLFSAFDGEYLAPHSNGQWHNDTTNQNIGPNLPVKNLRGTFQFTYTMPAFGTCPAMSSTAKVTVIRAPESGTANRVSLCGSDGLTAYTDYDLFNSLSGEDAGGVWRDNSNTGELTTVGDHNIDIQKIFNRLGAGDYSFTYTVASTNPICSNESTSIRIRLERKLDFTDAKVTVDSDICETEIPTATYSVTITKGATTIPNGSYYVSFNVSGPNGGSETIMANFTNGVLIFPINSDYFQGVGNFTVSINDIYSVNSERACKNIINNLSDVLSIYPIPDLTGAKIAPITTCQNSNTLVSISDAARIINGDYDIVYNISGANNASSQIARVTFVGGSASFTMPSILNSQSGTGEIKITNITHVISQCTNSADLKGTILINPLPNVPTLRIQINDVCFGSPVTASVSGLGSLTNVTLSYVLTGSNLAAVQTVTLTATNGSASFVVPAGLLINTGSTTATVTNLINNTTTCGINITGVADPFSLNPIPVAPTAGNQSFCKSDLATIASLEPKGTQYKWYNSATLTTPLANTYVLKEENYYVTETTLNCTSSATMIIVTLKDTPAPELNPDGQNFCGLDAPTIADLSNNTNVPSSVVWYDAPKNGYLFPPTTALVDKKKYYAFDFSTENCLSYDYTEVTVSLTDCDVVPPDFFIPDGFSPNGDGVNDVFVITNIDFLFPDYQIEIFNRYGNGMYRGGKDKPGWDGINYETQGLNHGTAPNGVYFYVIHFNKGNTPPKQGRLYLNR
ncbi:gliding motility-associated C-terminal domain-containing protein [Flavobacterium sp. MDT1-60]|uniref:gliding motility-associated C-terminal domain-containing protein n=1 Tax=Flavobacterium sp. MDT1-60 TaxID=1979344 RepID=UPI00177FB5DE|nr:gliding motility-associated C-terminal domain-containing protein [Flavobacterium sp. MDT1-60]QOG01949.1 gliding motility-associated C-terminal domain-containing protein [Flavobacterium sp. MDT1-60]